MSTEAGWSLVWLFPDPSPSFAHGFTLGRIYSTMLICPPSQAAEIEGLAMAEVCEHITSLCMTLGWVESFEHAGDGWVRYRLARPADR